MASRFIVLSHREPYKQIETPEGVEMRRKTNGVFTTLDAVMRERRGTWIAWRAVERGADFRERVQVPEAGDPEAYTVRRVKLSPEDADRFYYDFTSSAIWPVLFSLLDRARFTEAAWQTYRDVNEKFARAACEEAEQGALIWVNDFHLMLTPKMIKKQRPDVTVVLFLHTTFPPPDIFGVIPWREELLEGLLHLDLMGFHIPSYVLNFANTVERFMGARPAANRPTKLIGGGPAVAIPSYPRSLRYGNHDVGLGAYPVGVDVQLFEELARGEKAAALRDDVRSRSGANTIILSAERLDYVKGLIERLECFQRFLERRPDRHGDVSFVQIAVPTRTGMEEFQKMRRLTEALVGRINGKFGTVDWQPVLHFYNSFPRDELVGFYTAADAVWVTPLRDGLNLVAKEYIASNVERDGVVILSEFAGAAAELSGVVLTNPYSPDSMDRALVEALDMPPAQRAERMARLRDRVRSYDVRAWARSFLGDAERARETARQLAAAS